MDFRSYLDLHFPNLILRPPLFYSWEYGLRFELGNPQMFQVSKERYMEQVYFRAIELFKALHMPKDDVIVVTSAYFADTPRQSVKKLLLYRKFVKNKDSIRNLNLEIIPDINADPDEAPDPINNSYRYWTTCRVDELNFRQLIKSICNHDVGIKPMIYHRIYFINVNRGTIFYIYDDRGCDVISNSRDNLVKIYRDYNNWILDYDRKRIDKVFLR